MTKTANLCNAGGNGMGERYLYDIKTESWQQAVPVEKTAPAVLVINVLWGEGKR
jgi:hypothetical protein